ncbi:MAG: hypothetical protein OEX01_06960, partial [Candidatus Bathyarchaeota archaeon]|nr:hypothetical protein [Candidatus Bathyarchaeota archaeon]
SSDPPHKKSSQPFGTGTKKTRLQTKRTMKVAATSFVLTTIIEKRPSPKTSIINNAESHIVSFSEGENGINLKKNVIRPKPAMIKIMPKINILLEDLTCHFIYAPPSSTILFHVIMRRNMLTGILTSTT